MDFEPDQEQTDEQSILERTERLQGFGSGLAATRDKWVRARAASGWDKRVQQDIDQYHMRDAASKMAASMMESVQQGYPVTANNARPQRSTVYVGVSRQKTNAAEARLSDILLPTDDKNWGIQPTPDPECARAMKNDEVLTDPATGEPVLVDENGAQTTDATIGKPLTKKLLAVQVQRIAKQSAEAMAAEIDDQLVECDYNSEQRKTLHDAAVMGTGVIKGPMVTRRTHRVWRERKEAGADGQTQAIRVMEAVEELKPASFRVDPRMVWEDPDCGDDVQNGSGVFELARLTGKRVRELAKQPGYLKDQLRLAVDQGPTRSAALYELTRAEDQEKGGDADKLFEHWIYWGELRREDLEVVGVKVPEDVLEVVSGGVEMIGNIVVRAFLNPLDSGDLPYDFYPWEKVQGSIRGYGVPYLMRAEQSVVNAAWRQTMDNAGITTGPQIVVNRKAVKPVDGQHTLSPFKFWDLIDDAIDPSKAFYAVEFQSHQAELAGIIEMAEKLGDQGSGVPMLATGEKGSAPDTVGGMQLLMNSANVVLRRLVKQYDDYVTKKHIRRYYDYNMAYSDKEEIKGDFQVDARGSSALLVRDVQNQAYTNLLAAATNPVFGPLTDHKKLWEKALQAQHLDPKDILLPDEVIEQNKSKAAPVDPRIEAAQINAQARLQEAKAVADGRATETEIMRESEVENRRMRMLELSMKHELAVMEAATREKVSIAQIKAGLAQTAIQDRTKKELAASEMMFKDQVSPDGQGI